ncbi:MAG: hypothetical protein CVV23_04605 [Ignavibacteriae bacterium HGW-Ignavibacteriae-2]|jgi:hypothetical protein|nr:hypothetical protein [Bacteroidota bacterium]PKL89499.1 MAG: hypothetical protein CVV23_04605 [Ignavibacteriae bacterium HGW-Ignavibacteriae-2]
MRISHIKDFRRGDKIKYTFPNPKIKDRNFIFGTVHRIGKNYLEIRSEEKIKMKLSQEYLYNIDYVERSLSD